MYIVTMLSHLPPVHDVNDLPRTSYSRTVGFFHSLGSAAQQVENNIGDINEAGSYPFAVIEKYSEGFYSIATPIMFYEYDKEKNKYNELDLSFSYSSFAF